MKAVRSVVVLGGGSAGLLAATALKKQMPDLPVRMIRSKEIGIIGVGEGTTAAIQTHLFDFLKLNVAEFYREAKPIWKLGINYLWGPRSSFNYTFRRNLTLTLQNLRPMGFYCQDDLACSSLESALITQKRAFVRCPKSNLPETTRGHAFHLENAIFVDYMEKVALRMGVEIVEDKVISVQCNENGVERLNLESGRFETADLFVDCSGFVSELLGKTLHEPFNSYESSLFCDRAVVGGWERGLGELIQPYTVAETMDAGWAWRIDHEHHINRGYVYSSSFISDEAAEVEFRLKNPLIRKTRIVKFRTGRHHRSWVKNVVAMGNAAGFVEPLEATAIAAICEQSMALANGLLGCNRKFGTQLTETYNKRDAQYWDSIRRFLAIHYKFNTRLSTPFWQAVRHDTDLAGAETVVDYYLENGPDVTWAETLLDPHDQFGLEGYWTMMVGQQVPYKNQYEITSVEAATIRNYRMDNQRRASMGYHAESALNIVRMPKWEWNY